MLVLTAVVLMTSVGTAGQQSPKRSYDVVMKDVGATVATLRRNLDAGEAGLVAADAGKLERL